MDTITTTTFHKIDIHSHIIYDVDDGCKSFDESIKAIDSLSKIGIKKVILTPHFSYYVKDLNIQKKYNNLNNHFKNKNISTKLTFEFRLNYKSISLLKELIDKKQIDKQKYILLELDRCESNDFDIIIEMIGTVMDMGYEIVFAHPELYLNYRKTKYIKELKKLGILIQCDAASFIDKKNKDAYKFSHKLLKENLVDIIASDFHNNTIRSYDPFNECYNYIYNAYGFEKSKLLFYDNPNIVFENK